MLPVVDKPLIQYAVEEAQAAGIEEFIFVTGRGKAAIEDHFDHSIELNMILSERGKGDDPAAAAGARKGVVVGKDGVIHEVLGGVWIMKTQKQHNHTTYQ